MATIVERKSGVAQETSVASSTAELCVRLINVDQDFETGLAAARAHLHLCHTRFGDARKEWTAGFLARGVGGASALTRHLAASASDTRTLPPAMGMGAEERRFILSQYAAQGLLSGCVLQNFSNASNCHEPLASVVHGIHGWHVGAGSHANNHAVLYRQLLQSVDANLPDIGSSRFPDCARSLPISWSLPAYRLSLSMFPGEYQAEILGAAMFELVIAIPAIVRKAIDGDTAGLKYAQAVLSPGRDRALAEVEAAIAEAIRSGSTANDTASRVVNGFMSSRQHLQDWNCAIVRLIESGYLKPAQTMLDMVSNKAKYAVGYHRRLKLGDEAFDDLIARNPEQFLKQLARSRWVTPGQPEASLLLTRLIAFGGPMFRVFSDAEVEIIRRWIHALGTIADRQADQSTVSMKFPPQPASVSPLVPTYHLQPPQRSRTGVRDLYHQLLNIDCYPQVRSQALLYAQSWFARSANQAQRGDNTVPFKHYTHAELRGWFEKKAIAQAESYCATSGHMDKTRMEVIDEALQLCPMILTDGAWLQRWGNAGLVESKIGALLYKIFSDEVGNGDPALNHPNIYRNLMQQMGIDLPDFRTREFACFEQFTDAAFSVPVFWLSVSQFPRRFLPETLGLNLAMELSGVGGAYRTARDELRRHGFSTLFVDLHNTIDNVSSGHSAMALEAIELHMDEFLNGYSSGLVAAQWRRVWTGFRSLSPPKRSWTEFFARPRYAA